MEAEDSNPFLSDEPSEIDSKNPFDDTGDFMDGGGDLDETPDFDFEASKPTLQVEEKSPPANLPTYTSLEEEQVHTIMRSVSMEDTDTLEDRKKAMSDSQDLFVKVDSPEKHVEGYVSYGVITQTTRTEFEKAEYKVRRRYQDFLWLRQKLEESYPTHIIPPLPEKFSFTKNLTDKYDADFLKTRQKALDKFMCRVVDHPVLSFNQNLKTFLSAKAWEMTTARKKAPGAASKVGGSVKNTAAQLMMKNRDELFTEQNQYNTAFQAKTKSFLTIADMIAQDRFFLLEDSTEYGSSFRLWANSESKLAETLNGVSESIDKSCVNLKSILRIQELRFCEPIKEYNLYCDAVKYASKRRDQIQMEQELVTEELAKRRAEKEEVESGEAKSFAQFFGKDPEKAKEERLTKLNQQIRDLTAEVETLANNRVKADEDFKADLERWNASKKSDIKALLMDLADKHIKFYESNIAAWQGSLEVIGKPRKMPANME